jgi:hypothetical protein
VPAETSGNRGSAPGKKLVALVGIFFGFGFVAGFLSGFNCDRILAERRDRDVVTAERTSVSADKFIAPVRSADPAPPEEQGEAQFDSELVLEGHELEEDENGLFISGTIYNRSTHGFDAVRVTFDLCDSKGKAYSGITDITHDKMEPGDSWGFTIYIPYSDMGLFSSYRLQSIMGTTR